MKEFYVRNARVWVKVARDPVHFGFSFVIGYKNDHKGFSTVSYPHKFMPTIKDAREMAQTKAADYA